MKYKKVEITAEEAANILFVQAINNLIHPLLNPKIGDSMLISGEEYSEIQNVLEAKKEDLKKTELKDVFTLVDADLYWVKKFMEGIKK